MKGYLAEKLKAIPVWRWILLEILFLCTTALLADYYYGNGSLLIHVSGKGIPENAIARITEPFYMVDPSRNKKKGGSGLGLALVAEIVRAHGAELSINSEIGKGTMVKIIFPENNSKTT